jgi:hypothetical protein
MNCRDFTKHRKPEASGMTLVETLVAVGLSSLILAAACVMYIFVLRSFMMAGNYTDMDARSRYTVDAMLKEIRQCTLVTAFQSTSTNSFLSLTNITAGTGVTYSWNSDSRNLVRDKTGEDSRVYLTECDSWLFQLYQRTPHTGGVYVFFPATNSFGTNDASIAKIINMSWRCSRQVIGRKMNTENVQTAQVVIRNKQ